jgi:branched-chain amino acid transport system permease protein
MCYILQQSINGIQLGAVYALIALGYTMVYGVLRLIKFATVIFLCWARSSDTSHLQAAYSRSAGIVKRWLYRNGGLYHREGRIQAPQECPEDIVAYHPVGVSLFLEYTLSLNVFFHTQLHCLSEAVRDQGLDFLLVTVTNVQLLIFGITFLSLFCSHPYLPDKIGTAMRAVSFNQEAASLMGVNMTRSFRLLLW